MSEGQRGFCHKVVEWLIENGIKTHCNASLLFIFNFFVVTEQCSVTTAFVISSVTQVKSRDLKLLLYDFILLIIRACITSCSVC